MIELFILIFQKYLTFVFEEARKSLTFIIRAKPMMEGRLELLNYFIEQSISLIP